MVVVVVVVVVVAGAWRPATAPQHCTQQQMQTVSR